MSNVGDDVLVQHLAERVERVLLLRAEDADVGKDALERFFDRDHGSRLQRRVPSQRCSVSPEYSLRTTTPPDGAA